MRKLVSIQKIEEILPIENADAIEKVRIKGWWVVIKKGEFKIGDLCLYFEIGSLLPNISQFSFLLKSTSLKKMITDDNKEIEGIRLKTVKLRGQVSQGLVLPLSSFKIDQKEIDLDVTKLLNVYKYELPIPACMSGEILGTFPGFIPKTDEERIQNCLDIFEKYRGRRFYVTSKIDGTSSTMYKYGNHFGVCGRNWEFRENDENIFWAFVKKYNIKERIPEGFAIQAEVAGEGIQKNRQKIKGHDFFVFYVFDIDNYKYLKLDDMKHFVSDLGLKTVPIIDGDFTLNHTYEELLLMADNRSPFSSEALQEGLVFVLYDSDEKISFKVISNKYLLKHGL